MLREGDWKEEKRERGKESREKRNEIKRDLFSSKLMYVFHIQARNYVVEDLLNEPKVATDERERTS